MATYGLPRAVRRKWILSRVTRGSLRVLSGWPRNYRRRLVRRMRLLVNLRGRLMECLYTWRRRPRVLVYGNLRLSL